MGTPALYHGAYVTKRHRPETTKVGSLDVRVDEPLNSTELAQLQKSWGVGVPTIRKNVPLRSREITHSDGTTSVRKLMLRREGTQVFLRYYRGNPMGYNPPGR